MGLSHILLTNFMMLELLVIQQNDIDKAVMRNAKGLRFLVLDELHTHRARQGADVALLVRCVRERRRSPFPVHRHDDVRSSSRASGERVVVLELEPGVEEKLLYRRELQPLLTGFE